MATGYRPEVSGFVVPPAEVAANPGRVAYPGKSITSAVSVIT